MRVQRGRGGMVSKSASQPAPVRNTTRARPSLNRRSVQEHIAIWDGGLPRNQLRQAGQQAGPRPQQDGQGGEVRQQGPDGPPAAGPAPAIDGHTIGRGVGEEMVSLRERVDPVVPGPLPCVQEHEAGWGEIDRLGVWEYMLCVKKFLLSKGRPGAWPWTKFTERFWKQKNMVRIWIEPLNGVFSATGSPKKTPIDGRAGVGQIRKRFDAVVNGDYGELVRL